MNTIDYDELVTEYNSSLVNVLRGFRPKFAFLEMWVPDSNHVKSILNLVETAKINGEDSFQIFLTKQTASEIDLNKLKSELAQFGRFQLQENDKGVTMIISDLCSGDKSRSSSGSFDAVPKQYQNKLMKAAEDIRYEKTIVDEEGLIVIRSNVDGVSLFVAVDPTAHMIREVAHAGTRNIAQKALLDAFCEKIEKTPIQEASDHGVIQLEYSLRDNKLERPSIGIVNVFNMDQMFQLPLKLIRDLLADYQGKTGRKDTKNFWYPGAREQWKTKTDEEKLAWIQKVFEDKKKSALPADASIRATKVEQGVKVNVEFEGPVDNWQKATAILRLESVLREQVENRIQLFLEPVKDKNKARRL